MSHEDGNVLLPWSSFTETSQWEWDTMDGRNCIQTAAHKVPPFDMFIMLVIMIFQSILTVALRFVEE